MNRPILAALIVAAACPAAAVRAVPKPVSPSQSQPPARAMMAWLPGETSCGGRPVRTVMLRRPRLAMAWASSPAPASTAVSYRFRIDAQGRPLSITRADPAFVPFGDDLAPSLAVARFAAGAPREECAITYTARRTTIAETPEEDLVAYTMAPDNGPLPQEGWDRIQRPGATCQNAPRPAPLTRAYPDFGRVPATPGVRDWTLVSYDLDAGGRPTGPQVVLTTRNAALDEAAVAAVAASRFNGGPRAGCLYPYWRSPAPYVAPPAPDPATLAPADARCDRVEWATQPPLVYPPAYRRRAIEGWAIIAFDVAPWGATGSVRTLAAEPAADFGAQAQRMIAAAKAPPSPTGRTGCVQTVRFAMTAPDEAPPTDAY